MATNTERLFAFCICAGLPKHNHRPCLLLKKPNESSSAFWHLSLPPASQLLFNSFLFSLSFTNVYTHEQFHTLTVQLKQWGYWSIWSYLHTERMETFNSELLGERNIPSCLFAEHHGNAWHCRCRMHHFLSVLLNLVVVKPSGKNKPKQSCATL